MPESCLHAPLTSSAVHLCIDMQNIFAPGAPWGTPWLERVAPVVTALAERFAAQTVFTRLITPARPEHMPGTWQRYYRKWRDTTRERVDAGLLDLLPSLGRLAPPAAVIDKTRYLRGAAARRAPQCA